MTTKSKKFDLISVYIILIVFTSTLYLFFKGFLAHQTFGEWDGVMHFFAGKSLLSEGKYIGWASNYWPPLQPMLLNLGSPFIVGKFLSLISGFLLLISSFFISKHFLKENLYAFMATLFVFSNFLFFEIFLLVENHALETAFIFLSILFFIRGESTLRANQFFLAGIFIGLASMSRYTSFSIFLISTFYIWFFISNNRAYIFRYLLGFLTICMPWFMQNWILNGSPIASWQFINVGIGMFGQDFTEITLKYDGLTSLIFSEPITFIANYFSNIFSSAKQLIGSFLTYSNEITVILGLVVLTLGALLLLKKGIFYNLITNYRYFILVIIGYIGFSSIAFVFQEGLSPAIFIFILILSIIFLAHLPFYKYLIFLLIFINLMLTNINLNTFIENEKDDWGQLPSLKENLQVLDIYHDKNLTIGSLNPAIGFYSNLNWVFNPPIEYKDLCQLIDTDFDKKVLGYFPYFPNHLKDLKKDFIYFTRGDLEHNNLLNNELVIINPVCKDYELELLLQTEDTSLYRVIR